MVDVFLRHKPGERLRALMFQLTCERWQMERGVNLRVIEADPDDKNFQWTSRAFAEQNARTDPYIFADSDHLILGRDWTSRMLQVWESNPGYVILSASSAIRTETTYEGPLCQEGLYHDVACVGAPMVHKKNIVPYDQFQGKASQQDVIVCDWLKAHGHKFALVKSSNYNHLGFGFSQVEPLLWLRY